jgi:hypothetical protein
LVIFLFERGAVIAKIPPPFNMNVKTENTRTLVLRLVLRIIKTIKIPIKIVKHIKACKNK